MVNARSYFLALVALLFSMPLASITAIAQEDACDDPGRYTFSWNLQQGGCGLAPRGGTSSGPDVELAPAPYPGWVALQDKELSKKELDRRAIMAMSGPYRTSFEFLETVGYSSDYERARPYQSWGTEYVYVVENSEDFISLQHIIVMFVENEDGSLAGPFVQKHWRQDWAYEKRDLLRYAGQDTWRHQRLSFDEADGTWAQAVYQVDDSPRYESYGQWQHYPNFSTWESQETWRPVPRRESSVRDDYDVLVGTNRHTIVPDGWVHEEENYKVRLEAPGEIAGPGATPYLAKELGVNRYQRIINFDFSAGDEYWQRTAPFWADVRAAWQALRDSGEVLRVDSNIDGVPLFGALFEQAASLTEEGTYDAEAGPGVIDEILQRYTESGEE